MSGQDIIMSEKDIVIVDQAIIMMGIYLIPEKVMIY